MNFWRWLVGADQRDAALAEWAKRDAARGEEYATARQARWDALAAEVARMRCPRCDPPRPIDAYSDENDYICDVHGFVNPVRDDGVVICGDGRPG